jgi:hypothetical protein
MNLELRGSRADPGWISFPVGRSGAGKKNKKEESVLHGSRMNQRGVSIKA